MDFSILRIWMSSLSFLGASGVIFHFISFFDENQNCKQNSPRWDAAFCGVTSGAVLFAYVPLKGRQAYMGKSINHISIRTSNKYTILAQKKSCLKSRGNKTVLLSQSCYSARNNHFCIKILHANVKCVSVVKAQYQIV